MIGIKLKALIFTVLAACIPLKALAAEFDPEHKIVIQVSTDDPRTQKIALNNAVNLQKLYGVDNVAIEIVAYGPGLGLLTKKSGQADRVESLAMQDITFSACGNTMNKVSKKTGQMPVLLEGVTQVTAGVSQIMELQEQGYAYVRP
jgi:intracellular sulfur oxidation DsrE/DsrF family protein